MKRDMDLVRQILQDAEAHEAGQPSLNTNDSKYAYHIALMKDAGLLDAIVRTGVHGEPTDAVIKNLTWEGHDFLDAARDDTLWEAAKDKFLKPGISWTFSVLVEWLKQEIRRKVLGSASSVEN